MIVLPLIATISGLLLIRKGMEDTAPLITRVSGGTLKEKMRSIKSVYGKYIRDGANKLDIPESVAAAIVAIESSGNGFSSNGKMIIRYEPHIFKRYAGVESPAKRGSQAKEYESFENARKIDDTAAHMAISMGLAQIMGFNHKTLGYSSPQQMFAAMSKSIEPQIAGMFKFIQSKKSLVNAARNADFATFAHGYNGPGYRANKYDTKMATAKAAYESL